MSGTFFTPLFGDCNECNRVIYADSNFLKKHYRQKHDWQELLKRAESLGLIDDLTKPHSINAVIEELAKFASKGDLQ